MAKKVAARKRNPKTASAVQGSERALPSLRLPAGWQVQQLRITLFHQGTLKPTPDLWTRLFSGELQTVNFAPVFNAVGLTQGSVVTLSVAPQRVDLIATPRADETTVGTFGALAQPQDILRSLVSAASALGDDIAPANRIALGGVFSQELPDRGAGYRLLPKFLPFISPLDPDRYSDFNLQINVPRVVLNAIEGRDLTINRITRWSVQMQRTFAVHLDTPVMSMNAENAQDVHALRVELDLNTKQGKDEWKKPAILGVLELLSNEVAPTLQSGVQDA